MLEQLKNEMVGAGSILLIFNSGHTLYRTRYLTEQELTFQMAL